MNKKIDVVVNFIHENENSLIFKVAEESGLLVGKVMEKSLEILKSSIQTCEIIEKKIKINISKLEAKFPVSPEFLKSLDDETSTLIDSLVFRFTQMQDHIDKKIFPYLLINLKEDDEKASFIDKLRKLEKLGFLETDSFWIELRDTRNLLTHNYPTDYDFVAEQINLCFQKSKELLDYWCFLRKEIILRIPDVAN